MAFVFSRIPVAPIPGLLFTSGLRCSHQDCFALFSNLEASIKHAVADHNGEDMTIPCGIYECPLESGQIMLYQVLDENSEYIASGWNTNLHIHTRRKRAEGIASVFNFFFSAFLPSFKDQIEGYQATSGWGTSLKTKYSGGSNLVTPNILTPKILRPNVLSRGSVLVLTPNILTPNVLTPIFIFLNLLFILLYK
jgi:hypothetical protein